MTAFISLTSGHSIIKFRQIILTYFIWRSMADLLFDGFGFNQTGCKSVANSTWAEQLNQNKLDSAYSNPNSSLSGSRLWRDGEPWTRRQGLVRQSCSTSSSRRCQTRIASWSPDTTSTRSPTLCFVLERRDWMLARVTVEVCKYF